VATDLPERVVAAQQPEEPCLGGRQRRCPDDVATHGVQLRPELVGLLPQHAEVGSSPQHVVGVPLGTSNGPARPASRPPARPPGRSPQGPARPGPRWRCRARRSPPARPRRPGPVGGVSAAPSRARQAWTVEGQPPVAGAGSPGPTGPGTRARTAEVGDGVDELECDGDAMQDHRRVVVALVDGEPPERPRVALGPLRQDGRLGVPRGRDDRGDRGAAGGLQVVEEADPQHGRPLGRRRHCQHRIAHPAVHVPRSWEPSAACVASPL
jgi:hypothetical protein